MNVCSKFSLKYNFKLTDIKCQLLLRVEQYEIIKLQILISSNINAMTMCQYILHIVFQEHEKRCWSVDFNRMDPKLIASGSDDAKGIVT